MVFEGEQSKTDKLQFIEAGASHDNSPDEGEGGRRFGAGGSCTDFCKKNHEISMCSISDERFLCRAQDPFLL